MDNQLTQQDILDWSEERHRRRFNTRTRVYTPLSLDTPQKERQECICCLVELDAWIAEYRQWLDELEPGTAFAAQKEPVYWEAITRWEKRKRYYTDRVTHLDSLIAKELPVP